MTTTTSQRHPLYNDSKLQANNKSHVLYALVNKKIELKYLEIEYQDKLKKLSSDIAALESTICLFDEFGEDINKKIDIHIISKEARNRYFKQGEARQLILETLKQSNKPLSSDEITKIIANKISTPIDTIKDKLRLQKRLLHVLNRALKDALIEKDRVEGLLIYWKIKEID